MSSSSNQSGKGSGPPGDKSGVKQGGSGMYRFQNNLPSLPVPSVRATCEKYLRTVQPLCREQDEYQRTQKYVQEFAAAGGLGEKLQQRLLKHDAEKRAQGKSWLEDWWLDGAYMAYRDPVVVYVNYFYAFEDDASLQKSSKGKNLAPRRAAPLVQAALEFRRKILSESLDPEYLGKTPLDMSHYKNMFNACRQPVAGSDVYKTWNPNTNTHLAVIRKNQFFTFDLKGKDGKWLSTADIEQSVTLLGQRSHS